MSPQGLEMRLRNDTSISSHIKKNTKNKFKKMKNKVCGWFGWFSVTMIRINFLHLI